MPDPRLHPPRSMPTYAVRAPLVRWLREQADDARGALPSPTDYWRWTHAGLEKLFTENGSWSSVRVTPASGTTACLGMLVAMCLDLGFSRVGLGFAAKPLVAAINTVATGIDERTPRLREPGPGGLFANFHVVAEVRH